MHLTADNIHKIDTEQPIELEEFSIKLLRSVNGLKFIHEALLNNEGDVVAPQLCDALEPFLHDLYEIEGRFHNRMGFSED